MIKKRLDLLIKASRGLKKPASAERSTPVSKYNQNVSFRNSRDLSPFNSSDVKDDFTSLRDGSTFDQYDRFQLENAGHRKFARVTSRDRPPEETPQKGDFLQEEMGPNMPAHPVLAQLQNLDGFDKNVSATLPALDEYNNHKNKIELQNRLKHELNPNATPTPSSAPTPRPG